MTGRLVGVGVGPGDPELLTLKGLRALREADAVFVPVGDGGETGRAEAVVARHLPDERLIRLPFALGDDPTARERSWDAAGERVAEEVRAGRTAAFATIGDPNLYSTFSYLAETVRALVPGLTVETVPGITAMQDLAARSGTVLAEGTERLALFPLTAQPERLEEALRVFDTVVCYKGGRHLPRVIEAARAGDRLDGGVYGAHLGLEDEEVRPARDMDGRTGPYLSTVILPRRRDGRGSRL
jgi:precorrin-2/cobalt-factor-2 C20-methyltransferase